MSEYNLNLGALAEKKAEEFLKNSGYKILHRNYRTKLGEVDIIAKDKDTICFIEVKCRKSSRFGSALEAVSGLKQKQISKVAVSFLKDKHLLDKKARFDVVALDYSGPQGKINLIKDAFELDARFSY